MLSRRNQLWWLIILSAITAASLYAIQGATVAPDGIDMLPPWFWKFDVAAWSARAIVESLVIIYLFSTSPKTRAQGVILTIFEVALIGLITLTIAPALLAARTEVQVKNLLLGIPWEYGLAAYTSLMMGAAGYAYRVMPFDEEMIDSTELQASQELVSELQLELVEMERTYTELQSNLGKAQSEIEAARAAVATVSVFAALPENLQVKWIAEHRNGDGPNNEQLAEIYGKHPSTISRWIKGE